MDDLHVTLTTYQNERTYGLYIDGYAANVENGVYRDFQYTFEDMNFNYEDYIELYATVFRNLGFEVEIVSEINTDDEELLEDVN